MRAPDFWSRPPGLAAALLSPLSLLWRVGGALRNWRVTPQPAGVPVLCVGNLVAGGTGKTPIVMDLVARLRRRGVLAASLSRGHGGRLAGPLSVDPLLHGADAVGDEPLLLSTANPAWIARDRVAGARAMATAGIRAVVLDDGFQNPGLRKDLSLIVVDGGVGFGNGWVMPAGPLREPVATGVARADALVVMGDGPGVAAAWAASAGRPVLTARLVADPFVAALLRGHRVLAFAGIGRPGKFFATLRGTGAQVVEEQAFPDHHIYDDATWDRLRRRAREQEAILVTTQKDAMRLPPDRRVLVKTLPVSVVWDDMAAVEALLDRLPVAGSHG